MDLRTCISPSGQFIFGIHKPGFKVKNLRINDVIVSLGEFADGTPLENQVNFPNGNVEENEADWIYEVPNAFPFRGTTFITRRWAESRVNSLEDIVLPELPSISFSQTIKAWFKDNDLPKQKLGEMIKTMPESIVLALAATSTDEMDLIALAEFCCEFVLDPKEKKPVGLKYEQDERGNPRACINNSAVFEVLANNYYLPDEYKDVMVLKPGVQGGSEIVGEWQESEKNSHIFEYLRRNSYIPWGHYAANMANDSIRYRITDLTLADMTGLRYLYHQRTYVRLAEQYGLKMSYNRSLIPENELENLRKRIIEALGKDKKREKLKFNRTLWGWNFGFDFAPTHYRLHASHQQAHQQFALVPSSVPAWNHGFSSGDLGQEMPVYACGDLIDDFINRYHSQTGKLFFENYIKAIRVNQRMDGRSDLESSLVVYEDENVILFVPKAQTSQWELQLMSLKQVGNILEADSSVRRSLNLGMLIAVRTLGALGARMITTIEYSKRFDRIDSDQRLIYAFLPKLPESPGAFSEAQLRWINGHYPEDFAAACRAKKAVIDLSSEIAENQR